MEKLLRNVYENKRKMKMCLMLSTVCAWSVAIFFLLQLLIHLTDGEFVKCGVAAAASALGFITVTVARKLINAKRPYEVYDFYTEPPRTKKGEAHPSRHCYSAAVIATLAWLVSPFLSLGVGILALIIAATRVATGVHFLRDALAGIVLGILFGGSGLLVAFLI